MSHDTDHVDNEGRNGIITAIGIALAFALAFLGQWSAGDDPWEANDFPPVVLLSLGILTLAVALHHILLPYKLSVKRYENAVKIFMGGIGLTFAGLLWAMFDEPLGRLLGL